MPSRTRNCIARPKSLLTIASDRGSGPVDRCPRFAAGFLREVRFSAALDGPRFFLPISQYHSQNNAKIELLWMIFAEMQGSKPAQRTLAVSYFPKENRLGRTSACQSAADMMIELVNDPALKAMRP